jgi:tripeptidyl-peptidase-1
MRFTFLAAVGAFALGASAIPASGASHVVHERRDALPRGWVKHRPVQAEADLPVRIGLTQQNLDKGYDMLMDV